MIQIVQEEEAARQAAQRSLQTEPSGVMVSAPRGVPPPPPASAAPRGWLLPDMIFSDFCVTYFNLVAD